MSHLLKDQKHFSGVKSTPCMALLTEGFADANFSGAVFDCLAYSR